MESTSQNEFRSGLVNGVGQHGFVARHGLYTEEQAAAAAAAARRIGELDLRTVRLTVVDQHGIPRSKSLSPEVAIAAMSNGLDFSGAIYSLDSGNQVFVPAFAAGGGFGIDEFTGFPDVGRPYRLDALRCVLLQRPADAAGRPRPDAPHAG